MRRKPSIIGRGSKEEHNTWATKVADVVAETLKILDAVSVRGRDNIKAMAVAMSNLEAIVVTRRKQIEEAKPHDADDGQGQDV